MKKMHVVVTGDIVGSTLIDNDYHSILKDLIGAIQARIDPDLPNLKLIEVIAFRYSPEILRSHCYGRSS